MLTCGNSSSKAVEDRGLPQLVHQFWREQYPMLRDLDWRSPSCQWDLYQNDPIWTLAAWQRCRPRRRWGCLRMKIWHGTSRCNEGDRHIWQELNYIWDGFFQHVPLEHLQKTMLTEKPTLLQAARWLALISAQEFQFANGYHLGWLDRWLFIHVYPIISKKSHHRKWTNYWQTCHSYPINSKHIQSNPIIYHRSFKASTIFCLVKRPEILAIF